MVAPPQPPRILRLRPRPDLLDLHRGQTLVNLIRRVVRRDLLSLRLFCLRVGIIHIDEIIYYNILYYLECSALNFFSIIFMSTPPKTFELMLQPPDDAVGKKCYAVAIVTKERGGDFPQKRRYFTTKPPRYVGLCTEIKLLPDYSKNIYFRNNYNEEISIHINGPFSQLSSSDVNSSQKLGFIEVVCKPDVSLKQLATRKFKDHFNRMPIDEQKVITDNMNATGMHDIVFSTQRANNIGGKKRKTTRKRTKRKVRKNRKMTRRRK